MSNVSFYKATEIAPKRWQIVYTFCKPEDGRVFNYLLEGQDYALVIDTMNGWGNMRVFCETLTDKPMKVVNTHFHGDHTGGNYDFDACYIHHLDIPLMYSPNPRTREQCFERGKNAALPEYADLVGPEDFTPERPIQVYPLYDGDVFDLGDRLVEVVQVGGHTPGCITLIDHKLRIAFSGDCCNSNTGISISVEEYLYNLMNLKKHQGEFDMMYGGHQVLPPSVIDDGLEVCAKVLAGTDDKVERLSFNGMVRTFAIKTDAATDLGLPRGKYFNMSYSPDKLLKGEPTHQVITMEKRSMF